MLWICLANHGPLHHDCSFGEKWLDFLVNENHKLTFSTRIRFPAIPIGSWLILMTCLFWSNSTCSWLIRLRSFDMMSGAASIDQIAIWTRLWSMLRPKLPTIITKLTNQNDFEQDFLAFNWHLHMYLLALILVFLLTKMYIFADKNVFVVGKACDIDL